MATTIQVTEDTVELLKRLREKKQAHSYDEVVGDLARKELSSKSMWGAGRKKMSMKEILEDLRDKGHRL